MVEAKELFSKLKIYTLLDLALIVPSSYSDCRLATSLDVGRVSTLDVVVVGNSSVGGKFRVTLEHIETSTRVYATFFRATAYHYKSFSVGSRVYVQGKLELYKGYFQLSQPRILKEVGGIVPKYKSAIKESSLKELISTYITRDNLSKEGLSALEIDRVLDIHFPKSLERLFSRDGYSGESVRILKFIEAYNHIKKLQNKRVNKPPLDILDGKVDEFIASLPFNLTPEQLATIEDIKRDFSNRDRATKRMVVGDVGSGKTMVILASAMMAYPKRAILMAPTSILALQLYEEAKKYLPPDIDIALLSQSSSKGDYKSADFIIATHSILYKDDVPKASLVMVDEQHRFGTQQRAMLEAMVSYEDRRPHYIQFSATPIPRTQAMMDSAMVDVSLITTTPFEKDVTTSLISRDGFPSLLKQIEDEIALNHQVLIIYPLVEPSEQIPYKSLQESYSFWESRFDGVYMTHGKDRAKEDVLLEFKEQGNILLATTVVEVGISLPRLTLIVIVGADRLGLATLHQLRGRVGRNGLKSWCYLYVNRTDNSRLEQFCKTTNGFDIARLDLAYRDSGDILDGTIQSGQRFVWLDMANDEDVILMAKERIEAINQI